MIEVSNLVKFYGDKKALGGVSFKVEQGEILGFLGPNGAGKSSLGNVLMGNPVYKVTGGKILFNDKAAPALIREKTGMSKNEFKRAVGRLLKEGKIEIKPDSIVRK